MKELTERQIEVLRLMARGESSKRIAIKLVVSERTVHDHINNIFDTLGVRRRVLAIRMAYKRGYLDPQEFRPLIDR